MQAAELSKYIENPGLLDKKSVSELQQLTRDFPYFESAHLLLSLAAKKWDASVYQQSLKTTAIVATHRPHLFNLIHALENTDTAASTGTLESAAIAVLNAEEQKEEVKQELSILKAAEISTETEVPSHKTDEPLPKKIKSAEEILEKEIQNQVVNSFVEKEVLKTQEYNKPIPPTPPAESFSEWLALMKKNNGQTVEQMDAQVLEARLKREHKTHPHGEQEKTPSEEEKSSLEVRKLKNKAIIDKIIENSPGIIRQKEDQKFFTPDIKAKESLIENEHLVTETLARIYALQGNIGKAIRAYEILSLKYPQKSAYFATLIQKLKNN